MIVSGTIRTTDDDFESKVDRCDRYSVREGGTFVMMNGLLVCGTTKSPHDASRRWAATIAQLLLREASIKSSSVTLADVWLFLFTFSSPLFVR